MATAPSSQEGNEASGFHSDASIQSAAVCVSTASLLQRLASRGFDVSHEFRELQEVEDNIGLRRSA